jgi:hypothetical protein
LWPFQTKIQLLSFWSKGVSLLKGEKWQSFQNGETPSQQINSISIQFCKLYWQTCLYTIFNIVCKDVQEQKNGVLHSCFCTYLGDFPNISVTLLNQCQSNSSHSPVPPSHIWGHILSANKWNTFHWYFCVKWEYNSLSSSLIIGVRAQL